MAVWVRLPFLPFEYYQASILGRIGNLLGKTLKIDRTTEMASRGKFARLCVEMDISKPLVPKIVVGGKVQRLEFEGVGTVCFHCGKIGHRDSNYDKVEKEMPKPNGVDDKVVETAEGLEDRRHTEKVEGDFGPWIIAQKKKTGFKERDKGKRAVEEVGWSNRNKFQQLEEVGEQELGEMAVDKVDERKSERVAAKKNSKASVEEEGRRMDKEGISEALKDISNGVGVARKVSGKGRVTGEMKPGQGWQAMNLNKGAVNFKRKRDRKPGDIMSGRAVNEGLRSELEGAGFVAFKGNMSKIALDLKENCEKDLDSKKVNGRGSAWNPKPPDIPSSSKATGREVQAGAGFMSQQGQVGLNLQ